MRKWAVVAIGLAVATLAAGCSSSAKLVNHSSGSSTPATVGDTLALHTAAGHPFSVTLTQVVDPAQGSGSSTPPNGDRYVATVFKITNNSGEGISGNAAADANLVGANGNTYLPAHVTTATCAGNGSKYHLSSGSSATACVSFQLKTQVGLTKVQFFPAAGSASDYGEWLVH